MKITFLCYQVLPGRHCSTSNLIPWVEISWHYAKLDPCASSMNGTFFDNRPELSVRSDADLLTPDTSSPDLLCIIKWLDTNLSTVCAIPFFFSLENTRVYSCWILVSRPVIAFFCLGNSTNATWEGETTVHMKLNCVLDFGTLKLRLKSWKSPGKQCNYSQYREIYEGRTGL